MAPSAAIQVYFDATRLVARGTQATPTGIDRVDLAYATALQDSADFDLKLLEFGTRGPRLLQARAAEQLLDGVRRRWNPCPDAPPSAAYERLRHWLESPPGTPAPSVAKPVTSVDPWADRVRSASRKMVRSLRAWPTTRLPTPPLNSVYVNTSHGHLFREASARWLTQTRMPAVFMVHDLIPIEYPEYNRPNEPARHAARLETIRRCASQVIVNSNATRDSLLQYWSRAKKPPIAAIPLGISEPFRPAPLAASASGLPPYFVSLGTIEARKNHLLLLHVWRRLADRLGNSAPRLILIGQRGWENQMTFNMLDRTAKLSSHVIEVSGLSDTEVSTILVGAKALLAPSFAEGYGLPVAEALALGVPVVASDIPAHREIAGIFADYRDPIDGDGWHQTIGGHLSSPLGEQRHEQKLAAFSAPRWPQHFKKALMLIARSIEIKDRRFDNND